MKIFDPRQILPSVVSFIHSFGVNDQIVIHSV